MDEPMPKMISSLRELVASLRGRGCRLDLSELEALIKEGRVEYYSRSGCRLGTGHKSGHGPCQVKDSEVLSDGKAMRKGEEQ